VVNIEGRTIGKEKTVRKRGGKKGVSGPLGSYIIPRNRAEKGGCIKKEMVAFRRKVAPSREGFSLVWLRQKRENAAQNMDICRTEILFPQEKGKRGQLLCVKLGKREFGVP